MRARNIRSQSNFPKPPQKNCHSILRSGSYTVRKNCDINRTQPKDNIILETRTIHQTIMGFLCLARKLIAQRNFVWACSCICQFWNRYIITVTQFHQALFYSQKNDEWIISSVPKSANDWSFLHIHSQIELFEIALCLVKDVWRNVRFILSITVSTKRNDCACMSCVFAWKRTLSI